ncbi:MAG: CmpA/NrtA family ABC transporter substrate-binding protein [Myxococcota bacterium]|nr:CmpA/NrtA family ABC transporter substrate-binding protein [Myxococcota bacterium]
MGEPALRLGFVALNDCAPLVIAKERGFFRRHGIRVELVREPSWANVRDKVQAGLLDGAQMLAPMPVAATLGLEGPAVPMWVPLSLGLNGNALTVSRELYARMREAEPAVTEDRLRTAHALRQVVLEDRQRGRPPLRFAVVFPFSAHYYELLYWAGAAGIDPARDLEIVVLPPVSMVDGLRAGRIDGYCVGEPWSQLAVEQGVGRCLISKYEIWNNSPEKVLAFTRDFAERHPEEVRALVRALIESARWVDRPENRLETVHVIAGESFVDAPVEVIHRAMRGTPKLSAGEADADATLPDFHVFHRYAATFPWTSHAMWFASQMVRWGQAEKPFNLRRVASEVVRADLYREAAGEVGEPFPEIDVKPEGVHEEPWSLQQASVPIEMGADRFLDGRRFDPGDVVAYLEQSEITRLRLRLDDLAGWNA